jgi:uncharacterized protein
MFITRSLALLCALLVVSCGATSNTRTIVGHWEGAMRNPVTDETVTIWLHIDCDSAGNFTGKLDSPDQLVMQLDAQIDTMSSDSVDVKLFAMMARFLGKYVAASDEIQGQWMQGASVAQLAFKRNDAIAYERPQTPKPPIAGHPVSFTPSDGGKISGLLTLPEGNGPFPIAIMLTGSGPQDRDEMIAGHRPFLVIADHLARNGIATFRFDDRGVGESRSAKGNITMEQLTSDVPMMLRALDSFSLRTRVDTSKLFILGHSEGGLVATMAANRAPGRYRGLVLLASPAIALDSIMNMQFDQFVGKKQGEAMRQLQHDAMRTIKTSTDTASLRRSLRELFASRYPLLDSTVRTRFPSADAFASASVMGIMNPALIYMVKHDPRPELARLCNTGACTPVLALYGANDLQVPGELNAASMRSATQGNSGVTVEVLPKLNHLFQTSTTGDIKEYARIKETISPAVLEKISTWINQRAK